MINESEFIELVEKVYKFHTKRAPGIPIGVQMVLLAQEKLGPIKRLGAIAETQVCLSDTIQFLTGCTVGNKYLKIFDEIGRYALTLYSRKDGHGIRVFVDFDKLSEDKMPEIYKFFHRKRDPITRTDMNARAESAKKIVKEFLAANRDIFSFQEVQIKNFGKPPVSPAQICQSCNESFLAEPEIDKCLVCSGEKEYYTLK